MNHLTIPVLDSSIYPGEYVPIRNETDVKEEINQTDRKNINHPAVNIIEQSDLYKIEVAIPGVKREELLIYTKENVLSVCAIHSDKRNASSKNRQLHEFNYSWFDRHISIPENADTTFISAEYKSGILKIRIPKATLPLKNLHSRVIVY
ncbi:MAG: Hsp20/alpha crystallin family protein [Ginsengibacter sp.]